MAKSSIQYVAVEADILTSPIGEVISRVWDCSTVLRSAGRAARELVGQMSRWDDADELKERATWVHGVAVHALQVVAELHFLAGRLQGLAEGREMLEIASENERPET